MKQEDKYFYKGKYRTEEGLKRALIKDKIVTVSPKQNYYLYEDVFEYCYDFETLRDYVTDYELCTAEEAKHFRKWLNEKIREGKISVLKTSWYHCEENDNIGTEDFWDTLQAIMENINYFDPKYPEDFIETDEQSVEEYCQTLTDEEFNKFEKLPDDKQYRIAMRWRIKCYNDAKR